MIKLTINGEAHSAPAALPLQALLDSLPGEQRLRLPMRPGNRSLNRIRTWQHSIERNGDGNERRICPSQHARQRPQRRIRQRQQHRDRSRWRRNQQRTIPR